MKSKSPDPASDESLSIEPIDSIEPVEITEPTEIDWTQLLDSALAARRNAYAPFSTFAVGAALQTADGTVFSGCNMENSSYGLTVCAERGAFSAAIAAGYRQFTAIAVVAERNPPAQPCGMCLQTMAEFVPPDFLVLLAHPDGTRRERRLRDFLPDPFQFRARPNK